MLESQKINDDREEIAAHRKCGCRFNIPERQGSFSAARATSAGMKVVLTGQEFAWAAVSISYERKRDWRELVVN